LAAIAAFIAAIGTVAAFLVIYSQLQESKREALENRHAAVTPLASIRFSEVTRAAGSPDVSAKMIIELSGAGVAYWLLMTFSTVDPAAAELVRFDPGRKRRPVLHPGESWEIKVSWRNPPERVRSQVSVSFVNPLNRTVSWTRPLAILSDSIKGRGPTRFSVGAPDD